MQFKRLLTIATLLFSQLVYGLESGNFTYQLISGDTAVEITDYPESATGAVIIPNTIDSKPVTSIASGAFLNCTNITALAIPDSVTNIGATAFRNCSSVTSIDVTAGNTAYSSLAGVLFNLAQTRIIQYPIGNISTSYAIPGGVTSIGNSAFYNSPHLETVSIPASVLIMENLAFTNCVSLLSINVDAGNSELSSLDGVLMNKTQTVFIQYPIGRTVKSYMVPSTVHSIAQFAFYSCQNIEAVGIATYTNYIGQDAFNYCSNLKALLFKGNAPTSIGGSAFSNTHADLAINYLYDRTGFSTPSWWGLPTYALTYNYINSNAEAQITDYPTTATGYVLLPDEIYGIPVTTVGYQAFNSCQLVKGFYLPDTLTTLSSRAFQSCRALSAITIPSSVTSIVSYAFYACTVLEDIHVESANIHYSSIDGVLMNKAETTLIMYPFGKPDAHYVVPSSITAIDHYSFVNVTNLYQITLPASLQTIGNYAFNSCTRLEGIDIPASVISIGNNAFEQCQGLQTLTFSGNNLSSVGSRAFAVCIGLTDITLPNSLTSIGSYAFYYCNQLETITLPNTLQVIERNTFDTCSKLQSISFPTTLTTIGISAFNICIALDNVTLPSNISSIGQSAFKSSGIQHLTIQNAPVDIPTNAFSNCKSLVSVDLGDNVTSIGSSAFTNCLKLKYAKIPATVTSIGSDAFSYCNELSGLFFYGAAPTVGSRGIYRPKSNYRSFYITGSTGFTSPSWQSFPSTEMGSTNEFSPVAWNLTHDRTYNQSIDAIDNDGDGVSDLLAYALDLDPDANNTNKLPQPTLAPSTLSLTLSADKPDLNYIVETSTTLSPESWTTVGVTWSGPLSERIASVTRSGDKQFLRLQVAQLP